MTTPFYRAFEDKHRGSRELIKERLRVYLPFFIPLAGLHPHLPTLDLGCGRGEWLELMADNHITAHGVDLDEGMLAACRERGLSVLNTDALAHLQTQSGHSLLAITGFHIAEHLPFDLLQALFTQARRVLIPGGLLILETPNPENLLVGASHFYMDPTHQRPLPSQLLSFLAEHHGLGPVKVLRLQEPAHLLQGGKVSLYDVLANVSPDYAIVAQAPSALATNSAGAAFTQQLADAFAQDQGISLPALASRYDQQLQATQQQITIALATAQDQTTQALALAQQANHQAQQLNAIHASLSWRITSPLRWVAKQLRGKPKQD
ncbi:MAG: class I SAM-dependent methyltransferase [Rhodoferax sp.]|nr:class I SAM-dependent methyltransferase [Rhodoferax sp.]